MVKRDLYLNQIIPLIDNELIKVITGIRRCGKSYLLNLIKEELINRGIKEENIILINFESAKYRNVSNARELDLLIASLIEDIEGKVYLFFDEIQNVDGWEKSINACRVDLDADIYITGSNSKLLSGELATHLTGRYFEIKIYPFSFKEFLDYKFESSGEDENSLNQYSDDSFDNYLNIHFSKNLCFDPLIKGLFEEYLQYGGFPQVFDLDDENKLKYLEDLFNSILFNDLISRYNLRDANMLKRLIIFLMDNIGKIFSAKSISDYYKKENNIDISPQTISNYINYIESSLLVKKANRMKAEGKEILRFQEKYYLTDHGFSQVFNGRNLSNISRTIENIVYFELLRMGYDVKVCQVGGKEVDFVCQKFNDRVYVQVTYYLSSDDTIDREFGSLLKINDNYPKYVISMDEFDFSRDGIIHLNLIDFLVKGFD